MVVVDFNLGGGGGMLVLFLWVVVGWLGEG